MKKISIDETKLPAVMEIIERRHYSWTKKIVIVIKKQKKS